MKFAKHFLNVPRHSPSQKYLIFELSQYPFQAHAFSPKTNPLVYTSSTIHLGIGFTSYISKHV